MRPSYPPPRSVAGLPGAAGELPPIASGHEIFVKIALRSGSEITHLLRGREAKPDFEVGQKAKPDLEVALRRDAKRCLRSSRCHCPHTTPPCQPHPPLIAQHPEHLSQPWSRPELTTCPAPAPRPKQCPSPTCACVAAQDMGSSHHQPTVTTRMRLCARAGSLRCRCVRRHLLAASTRADVLWSFGPARAPRLLTKREAVRWRAGTPRSDSLWAALEERRVHRCDKGWPARSSPHPSSRVAVSCAPRSSACRGRCSMNRALYDSGTAGARI